MLWTDRKQFGTFSMMCIRPFTMDIARWILRCGGFESSIEGRRWQNRKLRLRGILPWLPLRKYDDELGMTGFFWWRWKVEALEQRISGSWERRISVGCTRQAILSRHQIQLAPIRCLGLYQWQYVERWRSISKVQVPRIWSMTRSTWSISAASTLPSTLIRSGSSFNTPSTAG